MTFSSLTFTTLFFPVVLILYFICTDLRWRNGVLLVASLIFYSWGESVWVLAMIGSTAINYSGYSDIVIGMCRSLRPKLLKIKNSGGQKNSVRRSFYPIQRRPLKKLRRSSALSSPRTPAYTFGWCP